MKKLLVFAVSLYNQALNPLGTGYANGVAPKFANKDTQLCNEICAKYVPVIQVNATHISTQLLVNHSVHASISRYNHNIGVQENHVQYAVHAGGNVYEGVEVLLTNQYQSGIFPKKSHQPPHHNDAVDFQIHDTVVVIQYNVYSQYHFQDDFHIVERTHLHCHELKAVRFHPDNAIHECLSNGFHVANVAIFKQLEKLQAC